MERYLKPACPRRNKLKSNLKPNEEKSGEQTEQPQFFRIIAAAWLIYFLRMMV